MTLWTRGGLTWRALGLRLWRQVYEDELLARCAELAYFFLFSIFPLLLFLTTLLGYAGAHSGLRADLFRLIARFSPSRDVTHLLRDTLEEITRARNGAKLSLSLAAALWVASNGMLAVSRTLNHAYGLKETRRWWWRRIVALGLTLGFSLLVVAALTLIFSGGSVGESLADRLGFGLAFSIIWHVFVRWPLIVAFLVVSFEMVYNFAPNLGKKPSRYWVTPGGVTAVALWLAACYGLRIYLAYFRSYTTAYGSLGAVILLLVWFYFTAFALLMGGEINSEIGRLVSSEWPRTTAKAAGKSRPQRRLARRR
ncbi:MAG TPA: YihY/virulence factor BrkB family protein [Thermoanaerobaculia bacterium]|jgi:membrane protein|nr:YihY/virulence factor BrkB family protein [Thermoanaerobaculia bacterium]